jgi:hypothetical protein
MAPMSSTIARASTNSLSSGATRLPSRLSTPTAMAMSVAIGMPQPSTPGRPALRARKVSAGTSIPPTAAMAGSAALRGSRSSPSTSSRLISRPATKKNRVISPSFTQSRRSRSSSRPANETARWVCHRSA